MMTIRADIVIIGGGIAGLSAGWALSDQASVIVLETETSVASHASGRSAAVISETYGPVGVCALAAASRPFLADPPRSFTEIPLLGPRGMLWVSHTPESLGAVVATARRLGATTQRLSALEAQALVPVMRREWIGDAVFEPNVRSIDVAALIEGFRSGLTSRGGLIRTADEAITLERSQTSWKITTARRSIGCDLVINAAGAWADEVAGRAAVIPLGLVPMRRTVFLFPAGHDVRSWPLVMDGGGGFYFEPEGDCLLASPADETPTHAHDARADEMAMARAVDALAAASTLVVKGVRRRWAGLRTFASDRLPVVGFDPNTPGFFWLAAQGGAGIKTSPALAALTRALVFGEETPEEFGLVGLDPELLSPVRLVGGLGGKQAAGRFR